MKPKIKFSHEYIKIPPAIVFQDRSRTRILDIIVRNREDISQEFIEYDTRYTILKTEEIIIEERFYELPKGKIIMIFLLTEKKTGKKENGEEEFFIKHGELWTTIRRWTREKEAYYRSLIGKEVEIVIEEETI